MNPKILAESRPANDNTESKQRIVIDLNEVSNTKANEITKQMLTALDIEDLAIIKECKLEHTIWEITKVE